MSHCDVSHELQVSSQPDVCHGSFSLLKLIIQIHSFTSLPPFRSLLVCNHRHASSATVETLFISPQPQEMFVKMIT